jgi:hypothetical protein
MGIASCSGDDNLNPSNPRPDASATVDGGGDDGATTGETSTLPPGTPLCAKYGGYSQVQKIADQLLPALKNDCLISAYFTAPTFPTQHFNDCLEKQYGEQLFQCPGVKYDTDTAGKPCLDMQKAHENMTLREADFVAFRADMIDNFKAAGISLDDIASVLVPTINGFQASIVPNQQRRGNSNCSCANDIAPDGGYCGIPEAGIIDAADGGDSGGDTGTTTDAADGGIQDSGGSG